MAQSTQHKLSRVRKPRVHITYDVETGGAEVKRELPFVVGILGDFSAQSDVPKKPLRERKLVQIDPDNFNEVMAKLAPAVEFRVKNTLTDDDSELSVKLKFESMGDFHPAQIVQKVEPLRRLLEVRNRLRDLMSRVDRSEELEKLLTSCLENEDDLKSLASQLDESGLGQESDDASDESADADSE